MKTCLTRLFALLLIVLKLLPVSASAQTEKEFISTADSKTGMPAEYYEAQTDAKGKAVYVSLGRLAAGTYLLSTGEEDTKNGYARYSCYVDGTVQTVWLKTADVLSARVVVYFQDGGRVLLHDTIASDAQALGDYCAAYFPGRAYTCDADSASLQYDATLSAQWTTAQYGEGSRALLVRLVTLGFDNSVVITSQGDEVTVPTHYLKFAGNEDEKHHVAYVTAPRTGEASLRETAGGSAPVLEQAKTGRIVAILEYDGGTFTKILYDGVEGYIRTDCLVFHDGRDDALGVGTLHLKGKTDGEGTVTIRSTNSTSKAKVGAWKTGSTVIVHEADGGWYIVEQDGWIGYVQEQYLTLNEQ